MAPGSIELRSASEYLERLIGAYVIADLGSKGSDVVDHSINR